MASGLSQEGLAEAVGVSHVTVFNWESGQRGPARSNLEKIAAAVDKPIGWFYEGGEPAEVQAPRPTERTIVQLLAKQQDLLAEQQAISERQRADVARLTELLAKQQELFISDRQFQQTVVAGEVGQLKQTIEQLRAELADVRDQMPLVQEANAGLAKARKGSASLAERR